MKESFSNFTKLAFGIFEQVFPAKQFAHMYEQLTR